MGSADSRIGIYSFKDADEVRWYAEGISESCGPEYVDFQNADGTKHTVRRKVDVLAYGLQIPLREKINDELVLLTPEERKIMEELGL